MAKYKVRVWEKVSLWRLMEISVEADSEEEIEEFVREERLDNFAYEWNEIETCLDSMEHIKYDEKNIEIEKIVEKQTFKVPLKVNNEIVSYLDVKAYSYEEALNIVKEKAECMISMFKDAQK